MPVQKFVSTIKHSCFRRSKDIIEPRIKDQWYISCADMAADALKVGLVWVFFDWCIDNPFVWPSKMTLCLTKSQIITYNVICAIRRRNLLRIVGSCTCNVWCNLLSRICRSIRHHFKCSIDMLIKHIFLHWLGYSLGNQLTMAIVFSPGSLRIF